MSAWPAARTSPVSCTYATEGLEGGEADSTLIISPDGEILRLTREGEERLEMRRPVESELSMGSRMAKAE